MVELGKPTELFADVVVVVAAFDVHGCSSGERGDMGSWHQERYRRFRH